MTKVAKQNKAHIKNNSISTIEENTIVDDYMLPATDELIKLKEIDPTIIEWIKRRSEIEQDARIRFNDNRMSLTKKDLNSMFWINIICLLFAFIIIVLGILFSYVMIKNDMKIEGTIFAGTTIVIAASLFLRRGKATNKQKK